jgi:hypothetical protein
VDQQVLFDMDAPCLHSDALQRLYRDVMPTVDLDTLAYGKSSNMGMGLLQPAIVSEDLELFVDKCFASDRMREDMWARSHKEDFAPSALLQVGKWVGM